LFGILCGIHNDSFAREKKFHPQAKLEPKGGLLKSEFHPKARQAPKIGGALAGNPSFFQRPAQQQRAHTHARRKTKQKKAFRKIKRLKHCAKRE
jgi:hypothetical protein